MTKEKLKIRQQREIAVQFVYDNIPDKENKTFLTIRDEMYKGLGLSDVESKARNRLYNLVSKIRKEKNLTFVKQAKVLATLNKYDSRELKGKKLWDKIESLI